MSMRTIAVSLPLTRGTESEYEMIKDYATLTDQNLKSLILTCPGERFDIEYGVGLRNYLFEMVDRSVYQRLKADILRQQRIYVPYITITDIKFTSQLDDPNLPQNYLNMQIRYFNNVLRSTGATEVVLNLV